jgi:hypothetical protein
MTYDKRPARKPTHDDDLQKQITDAARTALVSGLRGFVAADRNRLIRTLEPTDVSVLTQSVLDAYELRRAELTQKEADVPKTLDGLLG